jgi:hypothetical protein
LPILERSPKGQSCLRAGTGSPEGVALKTSITKSAKLTKMRALATAALSWRDAIHSFAFSLLSVVALPIRRKKGRPRERGRPIL